MKKDTLDRLLWLIIFISFVVAKGFASSDTLKIGLKDLYELIYKSDIYTNIKSDSIKDELEQRLFKTQVLPSVRISAMLPNFNNSISPITLSNGNECFVNRSYSSANLGISISQLIPFTGGTISISSSLDRLDNFSEGHTVSYNINAVNIAYSQQLTSRNKYKWDKIILKMEHNLNRIRRIQKREQIIGESIQLFFLLYRQQINLQIKNNIYDLSKWYYNKSCVLFEQNKISELEFLEAEIAMRNSAIQHNNIRELQNAQIKLANNLNFENTNRYIITTFNTESIPNIKLNNFSEAIIKHMSEILYDKKKKLTDIKTEQSIKNLATEYSPSVSISLGGGINSQADKFNNLFDKRSNRINVSLSVSIPILTWNAGNYKKQIIRENAKQEKFEINSDLKNLESECFSYISSIKELSAYIRNLNANRIIIEKKINIIKQNIEAGKFNIDKLIKCEKELLNNEMQLIDNIILLYKIIYYFRSQMLWDIEKNMPLC